MERLLCRRIFFWHPTSQATQRHSDRMKSFWSSSRARCFGDKLQLCFASSEVGRRYAIEDREEAGDDESECDEGDESFGQPLHGSVRYPRVGTPQAGKRNVLEMLLMCSSRKKQEASSNRCHASSNRCLTSSNKKLVETSATLLGTSALLVVTMFASSIKTVPERILRWADLCAALATLGLEASCSRIRI